MYIYFMTEIINGIATNSNILLPKSVEHDDVYLR